MFLSLLLPPRLLSLPSRSQLVAVQLQWMHLERADAECNGHRLIMQMKRRNGKCSGLPFWSYGWTHHFHIGCHVEWPLECVGKKRDEVDFTMNVKLYELNYKDKKLRTKLEIRSIVEVKKVLIWYKKLEFWSITLGTSETYKKRTIA